MSTRPNSGRMSPSPPPPLPSSHQRDAAIQELRRGTELAELLRRQVELIPDLDCRLAAAANVSDISMAMKSSLSILESEEGQGFSSEHGAVAHSLRADCYSDGSTGMRSGAVARSRKVRHPRSRHGEELSIKETLTKAPENDGFHWRKYGEKKILNAEHPRLYYKCGYSDEHKCPAKKYVQQQDGSSDPPQFIVTLINEHTCATLFPDEPSSSSGAQLQVLDFTKASLSPPPLMAAAAPELKEEEEDITSVSSVHGYAYDE